MATASFFPLPVIVGGRESSIRARMATLGRVRSTRAAASMLGVCTPTVAVHTVTAPTFASAVTPFAPSQNKRSFSSVFDLFKAGLSRLLILENATWVENFYFAYDDAREITSRIVSC